MDFLIVDDDFNSRGGTAQTLNSFYPGCRVHETGAVGSAIEILDNNRSIDLVLLDLNVDDSRGIDTLRTVKGWCEEKDFNPRIVVVSAAADYDDSLIPAAIDSCATGFITKGSSEDIFRSAIDLTLAGSIFIPERYLRALRQAPHPKPKSSLQPEVSLTVREKQVAALLIQGLTYKQIARKLEGQEPGRAMSDNTVRVHVQRMAWKLRVSDDSQSGELSAKSAVVTALADQRLRFDAKN